MNYLSVCSGIEAATVAWHPRGWTPVAFAEVAKFPSAVLAHHWPTIPNLGDMTQYEAWNIGSIDVLVGGTPCQAFSVAGRRAGLEDARGNLALTFCQIADHYDPEWILWENVPGVLSDKTNAFGCLLGRLCGADSAIVPQRGRKHASAGMVSGPARTVAWRVLDAQYFGVAQRRRRVFVLAVRGARNWRCAAALFPVGEGMRGNPAQSREAGKEVAGGFASSTGRSRGAGWPEGMIAGTINGHARNPDADEYGLLVSHDPACTLTAREYKGPLPEADLSTVVAFRHFTGPSDTGVPQVNIAPTLRANDTSGQCIAFEPRYFTREKTGGMPSDLCNLSATNAAKAGDAAPCVAFSGRFRGDDGRGYDRPPHVTGDVTGALDTVKPPNEAIHGAMVRRLTPRECERLQGFPDDYTRVPVRKKPAADGPRYAAVGNSMAVPVMAWLARRIEFVKANF